MFLVSCGALESRLDANTYHSERINIIQKLKSTQWELKPLKFVAKFSKNLVSQNAENLVYVGLENIESNTGFYIETSEKESFGTAVHFQKGQVLFPKLRPYLNKVYLAEFEGLCSTEFHILDSKIVDNRYLAIFLRLDVVVNQTKYLMSGNTLPRLQTSDIENLLIPIPPLSTQTQIVQLFAQAYESKKAKEAEAKRLLAGIDAYLLEKLGIRTITNSSQRTVSYSSNSHFFVKFSQVQGKRFDPFYHSDFFVQAEKQISLSKYKFVKLKTVIKQLKTGTTPHQSLQPYDDNEGIIFLRNSDLKPYSLDLSSVKFIKPEFENLLTFSLKNEVIICIAGTVGTSAVNEFDEQISINQNITSIKLDATLINSHFLVAYLNSKLAIELTKRVCSVATIFYLNNENLRNILIPLPPLSLQTEIAEHIQALRAEAKRLENEAKDEVMKAKMEVERLILN